MDVGIVGQKLEKRTTVLHVIVPPKYQLTEYVLIMVLFLVIPFVPLLLTEDVVLVLVTISYLLVDKRLGTVNYDCE